MNIEQIARLLTNSGIRVLGADGQFIYIEDPSCILRSFETFIGYAWIIIVCATVLMLTGWAISMIRGAKNDIFSNLRNLMMIFAVLGLAGPIVNAIWGGDLFARGCRKISVPIAGVQKILDARKDKLKSRDAYDIYEQLNISDTGPIYTNSDTTPNEIPYQTAPLTAAGEIIEIPVSIVDDTVSATVPETETSTSRTNAQSATILKRAEAIGKDVVYTASDGSRHKRTGGSRAWRNLNPGNIRYSDFARRMGAIGTAGGFAVFSDEESGMRAIRELLKTNSYNKLTVAGAISRYAPPFENDTAAYHRHIEKLTGLSINMRMADLTDEQLSRMAGAIRHIEGWTPGRIIQL